jgi:hypothetical protein
MCGDPLCVSCGDPAALWRGFEFDGLTIEQCESNHEKWGDRSTSMLMIVLMEEVGEIARAILENKSGDICGEIIDASSVLRRMFMEER